MTAVIPPLSGALGAEPILVERLVTAYDLERTIGAVAAAEPGRDRALLHGLIVRGERGQCQEATKES